MHLKLRNFGVIKEADIELDAITVITGENSTGKSTVGKALYAIVTGLSETTPLKIFEKKAENVYRESRMIRSRISLDEQMEQYLNEIDVLVDVILDELDEFNNSKISDHHLNESNRILNSQIMELLEQMIKYQSEKKKDEQHSERLNKYLTIIKEIINRPLDDALLKYTVLQSIFESEFSAQMNHLLSPAESAEVIFQEVNENKVELYFEKNKIKNTSSSININREFVSPIYIDNPFVMDHVGIRAGHVSFPYKMSYNHTNHLQRLLRNMDMVKEDIFNKERTEEMINEILGNVLQGEVKSDGNKKYFQMEMNDQPVQLEVANLSTGMKSFSLLSMLKNSGVFRELEYIILDEPEIHLHPDWQLKYAELIILLSKHFDMKVLITSHSPYFIEAIELFSKKHNLDDRTKYYKAIPTQNSGHNSSQIVDFTNDLSEIYDDLSNAMFNLEELRDSLDEGVD